MSLQARRFVIEGRVQGVAFRATTQRVATELGLAGWVRNRDDGAVEALAMGSEDQLAAFADWLWRGPRLAQVTAVHVEEAEPEVVGDFSVRV